MSENVTEAIDGLAAAILAGDLIIAIATVFFLIAILAVIAVWLTCYMFRTKSMMLGFPSALFWALTGACFYLVPTAVDPLPDIEWVTGWWNWLGFSCFGMAIFCMLAMYALRTKKEESEEGDLYLDEGGDKDIKFIDEGGSHKDNDAPVDDEDDEKPSACVKGIRERAEKRKSRY